MESLDTPSGLLGMIDRRGGIADSEGSDERREPDESVRFSILDRLFS
jgi:hypothetical protein